MNRPPLRLTRPGQLPAPTVGDDSLRVLNEATGQLAQLAPPTGSATPPSGCTPWPASSPRAEQLLPQSVHDARDQELTWTQIGELTGTTATTAARRYWNNPGSP